VLKPPPRPPLGAAVALALRLWHAVWSSGEQQKEEAGSRFGYAPSDRIKCASGKWSRHRRIPITRQPKYQIYVTTAFEDNLSSTDERAGTIIHECSHLVLGTSDHAYYYEGSFSALTSAQHDMNADSYSVRAFPRTFAGKTAY
jgi:hypothetical protein